MAWKQMYYYDDNNSRFVALIKDPNTEYSFQTFDAYIKELISPISALPNVFSGKKRIDLFKVDNDGNAIIRKDTVKQY